MTERVKNKQIAGTARGRKADNFRNDDGLKEAINQHHASETGLKRYPLRIDAQTVIFVTEEKCNETYAEQYRERLKKSRYAYC